MSETDYRVAVKFDGIDNMTATINKINNEVKQTSKNFSGLGDKIKTIGSSMQERGDKHSTTLRNITDTSKELFSNLSGWLGDGIQSMQDLGYMQERLAILTENSTGATKEQVDVLLKQANAISKVGVASEQSIIAAQSQLATFDMTTDAIEALTPALVDYVIAEKGATASMDDFKSMANGLAQALSGNFATLTRAGFVLDDETKALISTGTEMERVQAIAEVLNGTYRGFNEQIAKTSTGIKSGLDTALGNLKQTLGSVLLPILDKLKGYATDFLNWVGEFATKYPTVTKIIVIGTTAILGLGAALGTLGQLLPVLGSVFKGVGSTVNVLTGIFTKLGGVLKRVGKLAIANPRIAIAAAVATAGIIIYENRDKIKEFMIGVFDAISEKVQAVKERFIEKFELLPEPIKKVIEGIYNFYKTYFGFIIDTVKSVVSFIANAFESIGEETSKLGDKIYFAFSGIVEFISPVIDFISQKWNDLTDSMSSAFESVRSFVEPIIQGISDFIGEHSETIKAIIETVKTTFSAVLSAMWEDVQHIFKQIEIIIKTSVNIIVDTFKFAFKEIGNLFTLFGQVLRGDWDGAVNTIKKMRTDFVEWFKSIFSNLGQGIRESLGNMTDWIGAKFDIVLGWINNIKKARNSVLSLFSSDGDTGKAITQANNNVSKILEQRKASLEVTPHANGGYTEKNKPYLVGEKGPELFVPNTSGNIIPNNEITNQGNINISISGTQVNSQADIDSLVDTLIRKIKLERNFGIA